MMDIKQLLKSQASKLTPFFVCVILYFIFVQETGDVLWTTILKCAPIVCLMFYTICKGFDFVKDYSQLILLGLIFSCGGDALLNIDLFPHGMALFALAQICYIFAFGFKPLNWFIAVLLFIPGLAFVLTIFKYLDPVLCVGVPIYVFLLLFMCWRSLARALEQKCFLHIICAIGSVLFVISDGLIAVNMFLTKVPNSRFWIMLTYYLAQLAITLSTTHGNATKKSVRRFKRRQLTSEI